MNRVITSTLLAEGTNDEALTYHIAWLLNRHFPNDDVQQTEFVTPRELEGIPGSDLSKRMQRAIENHPCDILFVHRDADTVDAEPRHREIMEAWTSIQQESLETIAVVPIQALEAWLLVSSDALFDAVGRTPRSLTVPALKTIEQLHDPKQVFRAKLTEAHGRTGRRAAHFHPGASTWYIEVASALYDSPQGFAPLLDERNNITAFQRLSRDIQKLSEQAR